MSGTMIGGAFAFGMVIGWVTYRAIRRSQSTGLGDIATVIGAVGGAAVTKLFPTEDGLFGVYGIGLGAGFFLYLITAVVIASRGSKYAGVGEWLGEMPPGYPAGGAGGNPNDIPVMPQRPANKR